jgi:hypothetical protein
MVMSLGLQRLLDRKMAFSTSLILIFFIIIVGIWGIVVGDIQLWWVVLLGLAVVTILSTLVIPRSWHGIYTAGVILALALLDIVCLFGFIVPILTRT